jgi:hypothetical protein
MTLKSCLLLLLLINWREKEGEEVKKDENPQPEKSAQQRLEDEIQHYQKDTRVFYNVDTNCKVKA